MRKKRIRKRKNNGFFAILFAFGVSISLGYAYLSRTLDINGSSFMAGNTWKIHFENFYVTDGSVTPTQDVAFDDKKATINFGVDLNLPGDFYEFKVDVKNNGSIGASLDELTMTELTTEQKKFLKFNVSYLDGSPINTYDFLDKGKSMTMLVRVEYIRYSDENEVTPAVDQYLNLNITLKYVQDDGLTKNFMERIKLGAKTDEFVNFGTASSASNGQGIMLKNDTKNDDNPIYYYRGNVSDNNVKWADKCWKIIRTTDTGGVKMIYNGLPKDNGSCDNSDTSLFLSSTSKFNTSISPNKTGYSYGESPSFTSKDLSMSLQFFNSYSFSYTSTSTSSSSYNESTSSCASKFYMYKSAVWDETTSKYVLSNLVYSSGTCMPREGYYMIPYGRGTSSYSVTSSNVWYVTDSRMGGSISSNGDGTYNHQGVYSYISLTNGKTPYLNICNNAVYSNGNYSLSNCYNVDAKNFSPSSYSGSFICSDLVSSNCGIAYALRNNYYTSTGGISMVTGTTTDTTASIKVSKDVSFIDGIYTLVDPVSYVWKDSNSLEEFQKYPYSCLTTGNTCTSVYYILDYEHDYGPRSAILFSDGNKMTNDIVDSMYTNGTNSAVKASIETWFQSEMINYTDYIEDVVYCNDRSHASLDANNAFKFNSFARYNSASISLNCENNADKFSNTSDVGNGLLAYPVGLITSDEAIMAGGKFSSSYLNSSLNYWTMTPAANSSLFVMNDTLSTSYPNVSNYVRPVISIKGDFLIKGGDGSVNTPFVIS